jgi:hypothetical protein
MVLEKPLTEAEYFKTSDGMVLPSLLALRAYLRMIPVREFESHVAGQKNDFAQWVEIVFGEQTLARQLRACVSREQMVWVLDDAFAEVRMQRVVDEKQVPSLFPGAVANQPAMADPMPLQEDNAFEAIKPELITRNETIGKKYEDIAKQLQDALNNTMPAEIEQLSEKLKTRFSEIMAHVSETRRSGKDVLIPALVLRQFLPKLNLARVTRDKKDFELARIVLDEGEFELRQVQEQKEVDVKAEVLALAGLKS